MGIASEKIPTLTSATKVTREQFRDRMDVILDRVSSNESVFVIQDDLGGECVLCSSADFAKHRDPDYDAIVLCAVRYALGRRTYMPSLVDEYIRRNLNTLEHRTLTTIARDIDWDMGMLDEASYSDLWAKLRDDIKEQLKDGSGL